MNQMQKIQQIFPGAKPELGDRIMVRLLYQELPLELQQKIIKGIVEDTLEIDFSGQGGSSIIFGKLDYKNHKLTIESVLWKNLVFDYERDQIAAALKSENELFAITLLEPEKLDQS